MPVFQKIRLSVITAACLSSLFGFTPAQADMDPRFELNPEALVGTKGAAPPHKPPAKLVRPPVEQLQPAVTTDKSVVYTVKPGDHMYKILRRDYGMTTKEAWLFMNEILRENDSVEVEKMEVGHSIIIPPIKRKSDGTLLVPHAASGARINFGSDSILKQSLKLESPVASISDQEMVAGAQNAWNRLVPSSKETLKPLRLETSTFSLTLDPERYPMFARMGGGRIVLDQNGSIPLLVKSLIENKDSSVKIVSEVPSGTNRFMASLLESGGFYAVSKNVSMEFGDDPKLTVQPDFNVEKTAESLVNQDVVLVNSGRMSYPPVLGEFLKKMGFSLFEPFASFKPLAQRDARMIYSVSPNNQSEAVDSILGAFSISPVRNRRIDVFSDENSGISLSVKTERYFEHGSRRYVVTNFDGDPVNYTLFRILETKGYRVVFLEAPDDFRKISEKLTSRMQMKGSFAQHILIRDGAAGYSLQMSGFKLDDATLPGGGIFLTDRTMDPIVKDLLVEKGYNINSR